MKLLDIFDKAGNLIGEVHDVEADSGFGCFMSIAVPVFVVVAIGISIKTVWVDWFGMVFQEGKELKDIVINFVFLMLIPVLTTIVTGVAIAKDASASFWDSWFGITLMGTAVPSVILWIAMWITRMEGFSFWMIFVLMWFFFCLTSVMGVVGAIIIWIVNIIRRIKTQKRPN